MIKIKLKFFGIYNEIFGPEMDILIKDDSSLIELKTHLLNSLFETKINYLIKTFDKSLFSNDERILTNDYVIKNNEIIYLLPPFSGG
ncbi:MAG TPA: MoaD/ThiS family protein [Candidatus Azoamicus sp. MARI]